MLAFMAGGAVLGVDVIHGDFKHIVAADADAMDFHRRFLAGLGRGGIGMLSFLCLAHGGILSRSEYDEIGARGFIPSKKRKRMD